MKQNYPILALFIVLIMVASCSKDEAPTAPVASAEPNSQSISSGESTSIMLSSTVAGTTFSWTVSQNNVTGATAGSGSTIAQALTLESGDTGTATFKVTPTANGVTGNVLNITVIVNAGKITYLGHVKSILINSCKPCHVAGGSNPNKWDEYATAKSKINEILDRVQRDQGASGFMPKSGTKLSADKIATLKKWMEDGLLEE